ncbi:tRNA pseudouridine(55) synthase TruB [Actinomarinicola tropica]|uniref:tRNA pseudouridine synthase B n=1 Tax=Actinomarinicola tropica TaxID=2789776 RepID=A0A5Q2RR22_9ACTN|nr:tRNA pseudouridine(55) synthase TruB [Actinomarinicola tropica]
MAGPSGLCVIDKPAGWTSHDVVAKLRGVLGTRKVGHAGTLDPDATGVLLVGVGTATRLMRFMTALPKSYVGEVVLGTETSTLDASGEVTATHEMGDVTVEAARAAAAQLTGDILQVPPMVSALKVGGRRLHELAREGIEVEREARPVTVHRFVVDELPDTPGALRVEVDCSSGTYVRTLAADLGHLLGGGAHLRNLRRTAIGSFSLDEATTIEGATVLPPSEALRDLQRVTVSDDVAALVRNGRILDLDVLGVTGQSPWPLLTPDGTLLAVYEPVGGGRAKPTVVIPS